MAKQQYVAIDEVWVPVGGSPADIATHEAASDPHPQYLTDADASTALAAKEDVGTAAGLVAAHEAEPDPHPTYLTQAEADALYTAAGVSSGSLILSGTATPTGATGAVGDYYLDTDDRTLWGPKLAVGANPDEYVTQTTALNNGNVGSGQTWGMKFRFAVAGTVTAIRIKTGASSVTGYEVHLFSGSGAPGTLLATKASASSLAANTWHRIDLTTPVMVAAGTTYMVTMWIPSGGLGAYTASSFPGQTSGNVTCLAAGVDGAAFLWSNTKGVYPDQSLAWNLGISPVFVSGEQWKVALYGVPPGGTTSQVLAKTDATDYAANWSTPPATGDPAGTAAAAITAHESAANPHPTYLTQAEADALYGGGGLPTRATSSVTTASLAAGASESTTISLAPGYRLLQLTTSRPARVRLYTTAEKRDADAARALGTDPYGNHGLMFEFHTPDNTRMDLSPVVDGYDGDTPPDGTISARIENMDVSAGTVAVTLVWLQIEGV